MGRTKIRADVFLHAAELIDEGASDFACWAICWAAGHALGSDVPECTAFAGLYKADALAAGYDSRAFFCRNHTDDFETRKSHRVFALLLAYEIARRASFTRRRQYRLLKAGERRRKGDEWYSFIKGEWIKVTFPVSIGTEVIKVGLHLPHRRRVRTKRKEGLL